MALKNWKKEKKIFLSPSVSAQYPGPALFSSVAQQRAARFLFPASRVGRAQPTA
jgi:hypothetical protein